MRWLRAASPIGRKERKKKKLFIFLIKINVMAIVIGWSICIWCFWYTKREKKLFTFIVSASRVFVRLIVQYKLTNCVNTLLPYRINEVQKVHCRPFNEHCPMLYEFIEKIRLTMEKKPRNRTAFNQFKSCKEICWWPENFPLSSLKLNVITFKCR